MSKPITDVIRQISGGAFVEQATEALAEAIAATSETGKNSEVILKIKLKKAPRGTGALYVCTDVVTKLPKQEEAATLMWPTPEGTLLSEDPAQGKLDLKVAAGAKEPTTLKHAAK
jgi:hypothetical protein